MILAQVNAETSTWAAASGLFVLISVQISKWISDYRRDRREREAELSRIAQEAQKQQILLRIADGIEDSEHANVERHGEVLLALKDTCIVKVNKLNE